MTNPFTIHKSFHARHHEHEFRPATSFSAPHLAITTSAPSFPLLVLETPTPSPQLFEDSISVLLPSREMSLPVRSHSRAPHL